ncbi:hypothetical protein MEE_01446, partial [Bartonella elizabethae F9251 = ATCC 49927]
MGLVPWCGGWCRGAGAAAVVR